MFFKVGMTVYDPRRGKGEVIATQLNQPYPIEVSFYVGKETYTNEGRVNEIDIFPTLSQNPIQLTVNAPLEETEVIETIYFEPGMTVYEAELGRGVVVKSEVLEPGLNLYPVMVQFAHYVISYTNEGKQYQADKKVKLSQNPIPEIVNIPINSFQEGELVWVASSFGSNWVIRYYSHYDSVLKQHHVFLFQQRSGSTMIGLNIKKFDDNPLI